MEISQMQNIHQHYSASILGPEKSINMEKRLLFYFLYSIIPCNVMQTYKEVMYFSRKILWPRSTTSKLIVQKNDDYQKEDESASNHEKHDIHGLIEATSNDVNLVIGCLGVEGWRIERRISDGISGNNRDYALMEVVCELLEDKNASLEELKEAFHVFDRNEDGFISVFELWSVLRRLGFKEGMKYEDCEKMINAFDKDSDGRISFGEFKNMMENVM